MGKIIVCTFFCVALAATVIGFKPRGTPNHKGQERFGTPPHGQHGPGQFGPPPPNSSDLPPPESNSDASARKKRSPFGFRPHGPPPNGGHGPFGPPPNGQHVPGQFGPPPPNSSDIPPPESSSDASARKKRSPFGFRPHGPPPNGGHGSFGLPLHVLGKFGPAPCNSSDLPPLSSTDSE
ncbi:hypothetical protein niasHT_026709 [Heterodera trifolii]|uniref:Uncharacterized protein n=1 Tax=Heterodera trifolii TaxID=157864 RepID=A0ABD2JNI7_9BILA